MSEERENKIMIIIIIIVALSSMIALGYYSYTQGGVSIVKPGKPERSESKFERPSGGKKYNTPKPGNNHKEDPKDKPKKDEPKVGSNKKEDNKVIDEPIIDGSTDNKWDNTPPIDEDDDIKPLYPKK